MVSCETGRIVYVSDSLTPVLNQSQSEWLGSSLYDQLHPDDTEKLREQLSTAENNSTGTKHIQTLNIQSSWFHITIDLKNWESFVNIKMLAHDHFTIQSVFAFKGRMLDLKTGTVKKESQQSSARMSMGARRSFICRMRCDSNYSFSSSSSLIMIYMPRCITCPCGGLCVLAGLALVRWNHCPWTDWTSLGIETGEQTIFLLHLFFKNSVGITVQRIRMPGVAQ